MQTQLALKKAFDTITGLEQRLATRNQELEKANAALTESTIRTQRDLQLAAKVQESFLPRSLPTVAGVRFAWTFQPCTELAGDSLTVSALDADNVGMYVLDVSGHGVAASLLAVAANRALSPTSGSDSLMIQRGADNAEISAIPPSEVATRLSQKFAWEESGGHFITMFYGLLNVKARRFTYASAGHPPAIHLGSSGAELLDQSGPIIGLGESYEQQEIVLIPGDRIYMYSDGVTEAMNGDRVQFGTSNLCRLIEQTKTLSLDESINSVLQALHDWRGDVAKDDISILALELDRKIA